MRKLGFRAGGGPLTLALLCLGIAPFPTSCDENTSIRGCSVNVPRAGSYEVSYIYSGYETTAIETAQFGAIRVRYCHHFTSEPRLVSATENAPPDCSSALPTTTPVVDAIFGDSLDLSILGVTDPDGDALSIEIDSIFQDEATGGLFEADPTPDAWLSSANPEVVRLRSERDPMGNGRVYTANFTASDGIGLCQSTVKVCYPIRPGGDCADDGPAFDSTEEAEIDLSISVTGSPNHVNVGDDLTYNIAVHNNSALIATSVGVVNDLPSGVDFVSASPECSPVVSNGVRCEHATLAGGTTITYTLVGRPSAPGAITNRARVSTDRSYSIDPDSSNDIATVTTTVGQVSDAELAVIIIDSPDPVIRGGAVTYSVAATNNGPGMATNVVLTNSLPPLEINTSDILASQGTCLKLPRSSTITCNFGTLANGASATLTVTGFTFTTGTITNTASATASEPDPNTANNSAAEFTTVNSAAAMILLAPWLDQGQFGPAGASRVNSARFDEPLDISKTPWLPNLLWSCRHCFQSSSRRG